MIGRALLAGLWLLCPAAALAGDDFSIGGSVRARYERIDGQARVGLNDH
jgi:hypothetical protein